MVEAIGKTLIPDDCDVALGPGTKADSQGANGQASAPEFIRLQSPPSFDILRHMPFIRSQLPKDQLASLEAALATDAHIFEKAHTSDLIIDCAAEESFTLETFGALLAGARSAGKDFILARVTTLDPIAQPRPQLYHSHYSAHHLNKVLFRTQPEEGLLHRMKSRNPLNNLLIVGDVDYFVVRPTDYDAAQDRYQTLLAHRRASTNDKSATSPSSATDNSMSSSVAELHKHNREASKAVKDAFASESGVPATLVPPNADGLLGFLQRRRSLQQGEAIDDGGQGDAKERPVVNVAPFANAAEFTSPEQRPLNLALNRSNSSLATISSTGSSNGGALNRSPSLENLVASGQPAVLYEAHAFATDDDFLMRADVREYFKASSVNPDDYLLFTLYRNQQQGESQPYSTDIPAHGFTSVHVPDGSTLPPAPRIRSWKNCWGLFYPPSPSIANTPTGIISRSAFKYIFVVYILGCVLALVFFIPLELMYFIALGMFFFILFVTVFLVECNPSPNGQSSRWNLFLMRHRLQEQHENARAEANIASTHNITDNPSASNSRTELNVV
jgi:hypothetical protein